MIAANLKKRIESVHAACLFNRLRRHGGISKRGLKVHPHASLTEAVPLTRISKRGLKVVPIVSLIIAMALILNLKKRIESVAEPLFEELGRLAGISKRGLKGARRGSRGLWRI